jgi:hypothetical protein
MTLFYWIVFEQNPFYSVFEQLGDNCSTLLRTTCKFAMRARLDLVFRLNKRKVGSEQMLLHFNYFESSWYSQSARNRVICAV